MIFQAALQACFIPKRVRSFDQNDLSQPISIQIWMSYSHGNHDFVDFTQFIDIEERVLRKCMNNSDLIAIIDVDC